MANDLGAMSRFMSIAIALLLYIPLMALGASMIAVALATLPVLCIILCARRNSSDDSRNRFRKPEASSAPNPKLQALYKKANELKAAAAPNQAQVVPTLCPETQAAAKVVQRLCRRHAKQAWFCVPRLENLESLPQLSLPSQV